MSGNKTYVTNTIFVTKFLLLLQNVSIGYKRIYEIIRIYLDITIKTIKTLILLSKL